MGWFNPELKEKSWSSPEFEGRLGQAWNWKPAKDKATKTAIGWLDALREGRDVSSLGPLNSLAQGHAVNNRAIDMDFMTGSNALVSSLGGDQSNLLNRMREIAKEKERERYGMAMVEGVAGLRDSAMNTIQRGSQFNQGLRANMMQNVLGNQNSYEQGRRTWEQSGGWGSQLLGSAISGASGAFIPSLFPKRPRQGEAYAA